jgi:hypothetical protein
VGGGRENHCGTPVDVPAEQRPVQSWAEAVAPGLQLVAAAIVPAVPRWPLAAGRQLQEGIRCGGTPIRSPRTAQRLWLSGLGARARLSTRAGDAGG